MFLEGSAFALNEQLRDSKKTSAEDIEKALLDAFIVDSFEAYELFRDRRWNKGESVDVYMASLRQLIRLSKIENEELLQRAFITGLPAETSKQLRAHVKIFGINFSEATREECESTPISGNYKNIKRSSLSINGF